MNKKTRALTKEEYLEIREAMMVGGTSFQPNKTILLALEIEANLGLRLSDIVPYVNKTTGKTSTGLRLCDIVEENGRYHLDIHEQKTGKARTFTVNTEMYQHLLAYCVDTGTPKDSPLCQISERRVQKYLETVCECLGIEGVSTHSFRKLFATSIYNENERDIVLVQTLLQHSSPTVTQRYIGIEPKKLENALQKHCLL